jgi:threonine/homoserine/homoserine lactone efflux protein
MLPVLLGVAAISLTGSMMPGPMFAVTVVKSYRSPWAGTMMALGHAVIEIPLILLIYFGFAHFFENSIAQLVLSIVGGGMIIWLSISLFRARAEVAHGEKDISYNAATAGIITSGLNPFFLLWWVTVGSLLIARMASYGTGGLIAFLFVHWSCDLLWLSLVSVLIYKTRALWGQRFQEGLFIVCSLILAGFGVWFIVSGIQQAT